jgi:hypothetical protein
MTERVLEFDLASKPPNSFLVLGARLLQSEQFASGPVGHTKYPPKAAMPEFTGACKFLLPRGSTGLQFRIIGTNRTLLI